MESSEHRVIGETAYEDAVPELGASRSCIGVVQAAEHLLQSRLDRTRNPSKYIAAFRTRRGREVALERSRKAIYLWIETIPPMRAGLEIVNRDSPGMPYDDTKGRNSNLRAHAPRLAPGHEAHYVRVDDIGTLAELLRWYEAI